ncbi:Short chain dehydrogenase [Phytophthora megakarya]|uniref:Short chain dehydrogenase n=1 Tax=Phytophthora megakarya TaxID=4795 RepID=A0A225UWQ3_9STRA|nr:Short chain dehydrogenase [Phytophthora megakarya]
MRQYAASHNMKVKMDSEYRGGAMLRYICLGGAACHFEVTMLRSKSATQNGYLISRCNLVHNECAGLSRVTAAQIRENELMNSLFESDQQPLSVDQVQRIRGDYNTSTKGKWLTIEQKCEVIAQHRLEPSTNYTQLAQWAKTQFHLSVAPTRQTIRNIIQKAADIEAKRMSGAFSAKGRSPCVRSQELEDQLEHYVNGCKERDERLTRRLLNTRAREILDGMTDAPAHNLSVGWLTRFMKRHGLRFQKDREGPPDGEVVVATQVQTLEENVPVTVQEPNPEVEKLREQATKRLREIEKEAREIRKYLRTLDKPTNTP